jgi:hypothetical protein
MSGCIIRILEKQYEDCEQYDANDDHGVVLIRAEIQRRLEEADDPRNCMAHDSVDDFLKHFDEFTIATLQSKKIP